MKKLSKALYRVIFEISNEGIFLYEVLRNDKITFNLVDLNTKCSDLLGIPRKALLSKEKRILTSGGDPAKAHKWENHIQLTVEGKKESFEWQFLKKDKSNLFVEITGRSVEIRGQTFLILSMSDITKEHQNQELENLIESSPDFIISYDLEGRTRYLNKKLLKELGLKNDMGVIGKKPGETWSDGRFDLIENTAADVVKSGIDKTVEIQGIDPAGEPFYRDIYICPNRNAVGDIIGTIAFGRDTTERKRNEKELLILTSAISQLSDSILLLNTDFKFIYANDSACLNLGYSHEELKTMTPVDIDPDLDEEEMQLIAKALDEGKSIPILERRHRSKEGNIYPVEVSTSAVVFEDRQYALTLSRDISERKKLQREIEQRERQFRTLSEGLPDTILRYDNEARITYANPAMLKYFNLPQDRLIGQHPSEIWPDGRYDSIGKGINCVLSGASPMEFIIVNDLGIGGKKYYGQVIIVPEYNEEEEIIGAIAIGRDLSELREAEKAVEKSEREFRSLSENTPDNIARYTPDGRILYMNPSFEKMLGANLAVLKLKKHTEVSSIIFREYESEVCRVGSSGKLCKLEISFTVEDYPTKIYQFLFVPEQNEKEEIVSVLAIGRDITEQKEMEDKLRKHQRQLTEIAYHDVLTGLPNRRLFADRMNLGIAQAKRSGSKLTVIYLDIDNFKPVNDLYGHDVGDWVLMEVAKRIELALRAGDTVSRFGGDEFVMLIAGTSTTQEIPKVLDRLFGTINEPLVYRDKKMKLSASIGVSFYPKDGDNPDLLIRNADQAMLLAKRSGRNRFIYFDQMHKHS